MVKIGSKYYLVASQLATKLKKYAFRCRLQAVATSTGCFLWPLKSRIPSATKAADEALKKGRCRIAWENRAYTVGEPSDKPFDVVWPGENFEESMITPALEGNVLSDEKDPRVQELLAKA